jgi:hypothetical protein
VCAGGCLSHWAGRVATGKIGDSRI